MTALAIIKFIVSVNKHIAEKVPLMLHLQLTETQLNELKYFSSIEYISMKQIYNKHS